jgi:hypothetical protein
MRRCALLAAGIAALLLLGGIAYASIPGPDGTIHGCYKNNTGALITIDSAASCPSGYTALNWSQTGPPGPQGTPGISGYQYVFRHYAGPFTSGDLILTVACPAGKSVIWSGGVSDPPKAMTRLDLALDGNGKAIISYVGFDNGAGDIATADATAICAIVN